MAKLAVIGAGSWGTALACLLAGNGHDINIWVHSPALAEKMAASRENTPYLPGVTLPPAINVTSSFEDVLRNITYCIMAVPCQYIRSAIIPMLSRLPGGSKIISVAKGIENKTLLRPTQILADILPRELEYSLAVLSGPNFAREIAAGLPGAAVVAAQNEDTAKEFQHLLTTPSLRLYVNRDMVGTELGGALKNIMAIAAGVSDGLGFGANARAALITRGLAEITRLGVSLGANPLTFQGLSGIGDLVLTCTGDLSRNRQVGLKLGQGKSLKETQRGMKMVAEGVATALSTRHLARRQGISLPISEQVCSILFENKDPRAAVQELMGRALTEELKI